ncbi:MAG: hypothetical protein ACYDDF_07465 [Thermoplasmatota archaeon]
MTRGQARWLPRATAVVVLASCLVAAVPMTEGAAPATPRTGPDLSLNAVWIPGDAIGKWFLPSNSVLHTFLTITINSSTYLPATPNGWPTGQGFYIVAVYGNEDALLHGTARPLTCAFSNQAPSAIGPLGAMNVSFAIPIPTGITDGNAPITIAVNPASTYGSAGPNPGMSYCRQSQNYPVEEQNVTGAEWQNNLQTIHAAINELPHFHFQAGTENWCLAGAGGGSQARCVTPAPTSTTDPGVAYFEAKLVNDGPYEAGQPILTLPQGAGSPTPSASVGSSPPMTIAVPISVTVLHRETNEWLNLSNSTSEWQTNVTSCGPSTTGTPPTTICTNFPLGQRAGTYYVTFRVDPNHTIPDANYGAPDRTLYRPFNVPAAQLDANIDISAMDASAIHFVGGAPVLPANGSFRFNLTITNNGTSPSSSDDSWRFGLVDPYPGAAEFLDVAGGVVPSIPPHSTLKLWPPRAFNASGVWNVPYSTDPDTYDYISAGSKTIEFVVDQTANTPPWLDVTEQETEPCGPIGVNTASVHGRNVSACSPSDTSVANTQVYVVDISPPAWRSPSGWAMFNYQNQTNEWAPFPASGQPTVFENQPLNASIYVSDDDMTLPQCDACVQLRLDHEGAFERTIALEPHRSGPNGFVLFNATFANVTSIPGNWTMTLNIRDPSGNPVPSANATPTARMLVRPWPIQHAPFNASDCGTSCRSDPSQGWVEKPNAFTFLSNGSNSLRWIVHVTPNETGISDEPTCGPAPSIEKWITIQEPNGTYLADHYPLTELQECAGNSIPLLSGPIVTQKDDYGFTDVNPPPAYGGWHSVITIGDRAGFVRTVWWNFTVSDQPGTAAFENDSSDANVTAGSTFLITLVVEDNNPVRVASLGVEHYDTAGNVDADANYSLPSVGPCQSAPQGYQCTFARAFQSGLGGEFALAGRYNITGIFQEDDGAHLFCTVMPPALACPTMAIRVQDDGAAPQIIAANASDRQWLTGKPLTWTARAVDDTNYTPFLTVTALFPSAGPTLDHIPMTGPDSGGAWHFSYAFPRGADGNYQWWIEFTDSAGHTAESQTYPLSIQQAIAPVYEVLSPSPVLLKAPPSATNLSDLGTYWSNPSPAVRLEVVDLDGISVSSIQVWANATTSDGAFTNETTSCRLGSSQCFISAAPSGDGFMIDYNWTNANASVTDALAARGSFHVSIFASDLEEGTSPGSSWGNLSLAIVSTPPVSDTPAFSPKYRGCATDAEWNVSFNTTFRISAIDPLGPGVARIFYRTVQPSTGLVSPWLIEGPDGFQLSTYRGLVMLEYYAVDAVGNSEYVPGVSNPHVLVVFLDGYPPYFPTAVAGADYQITSQAANFTIADIGSGVDHATLFFRVNNESWQGEPLTFNATSNFWGSPLPIEPQGTHVFIYAEAWDHLGNVGSLGSAATPALTFIEGNSPPVLTLLAPKAHTTAGELTFNWTANDPDGDPVTVSIFYQAANDTTAWWWLASNLAADGTYVFNTTSTPNGTYNFMVAASDGKFVRDDEISIQIANYPGELATLVITPGSANVTAASSLSLSVSGRDPYGATVPLVSAINWTSTCGTIAPDGFFVAPQSAPQVCTVQAATGTVVSSPVNIHVGLGRISSLLIQPTNEVLRANDTTLFEANATDVYGNSARIDPLWMTSCGSITQTGSFRGPTHAPVACAVTASYAGVNATSVVEITPGPLAHLSMVGPATVVAGSNATYTLVGSDQFGNAVPLSPGMVAFPAPTAVGPFRFTTEVDGILGSFAVSVVHAPLASIQITGPLAVEAGSTDTYALTGTDPYGNAVPLSRTVLPFTAPTKVGSATLVYVEENVSAQITITIVPGPVSKIAVSSNSSQANLGEATLFVATGADRYGNTVTDLSFIWSATKGGITNAGVFTASSTGLATVTATIGRVNGSSDLLVTDVLATTVSTQGASYGAAYALENGIHGVARVTFADGRATPGTLVVVTITRETPVGAAENATVYGFTDAGGSFNFTAPQQFSLPGTYRIDVIAATGGNRGSGDCTYEVG